jgi:hypothetical protein
MERLRNFKAHPHQKGGILVDPSLIRPKNFSSIIGIGRVQK